MSLRFLCLFLTVFIYSNGEHPCGHPSGSLDNNIIVESIDGELSGFTTLQWQIRLGESLCYKFQNSKKHSGPQFIQVTYKDLKNIYNIAEGYSFRLAASSVNCICDCPGGANSCNTEMNNCKGQKNCINYYSSSVSATGCFFNFMRFNSALCCSIQISPLNSHKYRAIKLNIPNVLAKFEVVHRNEKMEILDSRIYNIDLNSGTTIDWEVSLQVSSGGPTTSVPPGWYLSPYSSSSSLYGNVPINELNEWSFEKLGWFKSSVSGDVIDTGKQLHRSFYASVSNCKEGTYSYSFSRGFIDENQLKASKLIENMFPFVKSVRLWRRHVEVTHSESPLLILTLQHRDEVDIVIQFHNDSSFDDFTGYVLRDEDSHQFLHLNISNVRGTLLGSVESDGGHKEALTLSFEKGSRVNVSRSFKLSGSTVCDSSGTLKVFLHPLSNSQYFLSKNLPCLEMDLHSFNVILRGSDNVYKHRDLSYLSAEDDCWTCGTSWTFWLHPLQWGSNLWNSSRIFITVITLIGCLLLLFCCVKLCHCIKCCICCSC